MKIEGRPKVNLEISIRLTEDEAGALDALFGYDVESFLRAFYREMGRCYLEPHEAGLRSLHAQRGLLSVWLTRAKNARKVFSGEDA